MSVQFNSLHLFAGAGGAALGFQRAGFSPVAFCEIDPNPRRTLKKHWPEAYHHDDVKTLKRKSFDGPIKLITGGFPCQDISLAGPGTGLAGARSGLWYEQLRIVDEFQPDYVVGENVAALRARGLDDLLRSLDEIGYDAEWHCISASFVGAPHKRDRIWIIAYPRRKGFQGLLLQRNAIPRVSSQKVAVLGSITTKCGNNWPEYHRSLRMGDGLPPRLDRIKQMGNSCIPLIPQSIGEAILMQELMS